MSKTLRTLSLGLAVVFVSMMLAAPAFAATTLTFSGIIPTTGTTYTAPGTAGPVAGCNPAILIPNIVYVSHSFEVSVSGTFTFSNTSTGLLSFAFIYAAGQPLNGVNCLAGVNNGQSVTVALAAGTYIIAVDSDNNASPVPYTVSISGNFDAAAPFTDGRLNNRDQWATFAVYCAGSSIDVYAINSAGRGQQAFVATSDEIAAVPQFPTENTVIDSGLGVSLYRVVTGELQIVGPRDAEGKVYNVMFLGCPAQPGSVRTWVGR